jgi:hypothetical protein
MVVLVSALAQLQGSPRKASGPNPPASAFSDVALYRSITARVTSGADYYAAAASEQRAHRYPTWPPQVIREPTQTWILAALHNDGLRWAALLALTGAALEALRRALARTSLTPRTRLWALALTTTGVATVVWPLAVYMHEIWASLLILMSLALRQPGRWALAIGAGLAACLFRETALPFLFVMAASAAFERQAREAFGWTAAIALFCSLYAIHLILARAQHQAGDMVSPGWVQFGGLPFIVETARYNALLALAPPAVIAAALAAAALGLLGCQDRWPMRCTATLALFLGLFCIIGRMDNRYWGNLYAPLVPLGFVLAPAALADLWGRAFGGRWTGRVQSDAGATLTSGGS